MPYSNREAFQAKAKVKQFYCQYCGKESYSNRPRAKYCCSTCRVYSHQAKGGESLHIASPAESTDGSYLQQAVAAASELSKHMPSRPQGLVLPEVEPTGQKPARAGRMVLIVSDNGKDYYEVTSSYVGLYGENSHLQALWLYKELENALFALREMEARCQALEEQVTALKS